MDDSAAWRPQAFSTRLRTGRWARMPAASVELKFNQWHDPETGRFAFVGMGRYFGRGGVPVRGNGGSFGGGASGSRDAPKPSIKPPTHIRPGRHRPLIVRRPIKPARLVIASAASRVRRARAAVAKPKTASPASQVTIYRREVRNGYEYQIDARGRVRKVSGNITPNPKQGRSRRAQAQAGGFDRRPTDDGGHYIARRFNGPTDAFNHFAQDTNFNRGLYRTLEGQWSRARRQGKQVFVKIVPNYEGASQRPSALNIWFEIDGREESLKIPNESKGVRHARRG